MLTILHLTWIAFLKYSKSFFASRVSFYVAELNVKVISVDRSQPEGLLYICEVKMPIKWGTPHVYTHTHFVLYGTRKINESTLSGIWRSVNAYTKWTTWW